jgi:hypothetical protein
MAARKLKLGDKLLSSTNKVRLGAPGTMPPQRKPGRSPAGSAVRSQPTSRPADGLLTTGEHPGRDAYFKRTGRTKDPLEAQGGKVLGTGVAKTGPRKGSQYLGISLKGATYHVHYGPGGKREVFRVSGRPRRPKGVGVSAPSGYYQS